MEHKEMTDPKTIIAREPTTVQMHFYRNGELIDVGECDVESPEFAGWLGYMLARNTKPISGDLVGDGEPTDG